ncbi:MAG: PEP-CTERM sorting domain-containing protein [bacterium]|nr:PEP-CTERM sorting domain-containing protein [bacterium]
MKDPGSMLLQRLCVTGLSVVLLSGVARTVHGVSSYQAASSFSHGVEIPAEMHSYDPSVLSITFGGRTEAQNAEAWSTPEQDPEQFSNEFFDPVRLPDDEKPEIGESASHLDSNDVLAGSQQVNVPEPGTFALLGLGLSALVMLFRKKRHQHSIPTVN